MNNFPRIGIIILAAGASTRLGTPKQLLPHKQGHTLLSHTIQVALNSKCQPVIVVLGAYAEKLRQEISHFPVQLSENPQWNQGMGASIRVGIQSLNSTPEIEAVVLTLCDQPFISSQIIDRLVDTYYQTNKKIVACEYAGTLGVPALFHHTLFSDLISFKEGTGAKKVIKKYTQDVFSIPFPEAAIDIDTSEDYEQFQSML
jgi:molybdenum cofactor cytidylyltransferase